MANINEEQVAEFIDFGTSECPVHVEVEEYDGDTVFLAWPVRDFWDGRAFAAEIGHDGAIHWMEDGYPAKRSAIVDIDGGDHVVRAVEDALRRANEPGRR